MLTSIANRTPHGRPGLSIETMGRSPCVGRHQEGYPLWENSFGDYLPAQARAIRRMKNFTQHAVRTWREVQEM